MTAALRALQEAIFERLSGDGPLTALLGGACVYDGAPRNAGAPYIHFGAAGERDWSTATDAGVEIDFSLVVWSRQPGRSEALAVADRARTLLHDAELSLEDWRLVNLRHTATQHGRADKPPGRRSTLRFRARLEAMP